MPKTQENLFGEDELVIINQQGHPTAGGFKINSIIASAGKNMQNQSGGGMSAFKDLAVPAGLFLMQRVTANNFSISNSDQVIDEKLYTKLVDMVDETPKSKKNKKKATTRKAKSSKKKKGTRKRKTTLKGGREWTPTSLNNNNNNDNNNNNPPPNNIEIPSDSDDTSSDEDNDNDNQPPQQRRLGPSGQPIRRIEPRPTRRDSQQYRANKGQFGYFDKSK